MHLILYASTDAKGPVYSITQLHEDKIVAGFYLSI
jgi:hypothetical protein